MVNSDHGLADAQRYLTLALSVLAFLGYGAYLVRLGSALGQVKAQMQQLSDVKIEQMKFQVDQLWKVIFANAQVELVTKGLAEIKSPIWIASEGFEFIRPLLPEYLPIYRRILSGAGGLADSEVERRLFQAFSVEAGESIIRQVCLPKRLPFGAGVMAVVQACQRAEAEGGH